MGAAAPPAVATARPHGQQPRDRKVSPVELFYDLVGSCCSDKGPGFGRTCGACPRFPVGRRFGVLTPLTLTWTILLGGAIGAVAGDLANPEDAAGYRRGPQAPGLGASGWRAGGDPLAGRG